MPADSNSHQHGSAKRWLFNPFLTAVACIVLLVILLRLPNFTEPYWYGDEGIYLTIGNAMNDGAVLYKDIVDHKTPLIYYFARVGSQLNFRLLLTAWMAISSVAFLAINYRLTKRLWLSASTTVLFVILTSIPFLEGNIPNGELFVMGFVLIGLWILLKTKSGFVLTTAQRSEWGWWIVAGFFMGGAMLAKVPALFDVLALFYIGWLAGWDQQLAGGWHWRWHSWLPIFKQWMLLAVGLLIPLVLSVVYFVSRGAGNDYLQYGLLYNFHYVQNWSLGHLPSWGQTMFTLPVKGLVLAVLLLGLTFLGRWVSRPVRFATGWFYLALFASILSNRPYPHYLLQVVPPLVLSLSLMYHSLTAKRQKPHHLLKRVVPAGLAVTSMLLLWSVWSSLRISHYPVISYYQAYGNLATGQMTPIQYRDSFNTYLADNYAASALLRTTDEPKIFIWGTNPMLYALSGKAPVGRFTVAFHIQDLNLYQETIDAVRTELPPFIVVMKNEAVALPGLDALLRSKYLTAARFEHFTVWRRRSTASSPQLKARE